MDNRHETEEEMRARIKAELKAEIIEEMKREERQKNTYQSKEESLRISHSTDKGVKEATDLLNKDMKFASKTDGPKTLRLPQANDEETGTLSIVLVFVVIVLIVASYFVIPKVYKWYASKETPSTYVDPNPDDDEVVTEPLEEITLESNSVKNLTYPIMRNHPYTSSTYYTKEVLNVGDISNNDLLYNAFIHVYTGNIADYTGTYSGKTCLKEGQNKTFNADYVELRIDNLFTKSVEYKHGNFTVPSTNETTKYAGTWKYDAKNHSYIYYGNCNPVETSKIKYYNLEIAYDAKGLDKNNDLEVYYHVGFAQVNTSNKQYKIYSDAEMKTSILSGNLTSDDYEKELKDIFNKYIADGNKPNTYKYTFSSRDCSYQNYCFVKGEWVAEN